MLHFYDFEVFKYDWLVVIINPITNTKEVIINDNNKLKKYYEEFKNDIWVGFNSNNYDQYILKGLLLDFDPFKITEHIIGKGLKGWQFSRLFNKITLISYDVMSGYNGLKTLEGFMGNNIKETDVPFNIDRKLTNEEIEQTVKYCTHDVEQTIEVFLERKNEFDAQMDLVKTFNLPLSYIGKSKAQLAAIILGAIRLNNVNDEWNIRIPETLIIDKYKDVAEWFLNKENHDSKKYLERVIAGVNHNIAWGGLHGARDKYQYTCKEDEILIMADVDQLYPTLMVVYKLLSRAVTNYEKFEMILNESLRLKALKKKKERQPYKDICNITYGAEGDKSNPMYDPLHRNLVCIFGQLLVIDLIEKIEPICKLIQSNTDGILVLIKRKDFNNFDDIVYEWEQRTGLHMSFDFYKSVYQKDVNNYVVVDFEGKMKSKGSYVKKLDKLDYDLPIVNEAIVNYIVKGIPVETTIFGCNELQKFQKLVKLSGKYSYVVHNNIRYSYKCYRVFASRKNTDSYIGKCKSEGATIEKFANTPEHCFINNDSVIGVETPSKLDKLWYVELANERLRQFGVL